VARGPVLLIGTSPGQGGARISPKQKKRDSFTKWGYGGEEVGQSFETGLEYGQNILLYGQGESLDGGERPISGDASRWDLGGGKERGVR